MSKPRVVYRNWIVDLGFNPEDPDMLQEEENEARQRDEYVREQVSKAISRLPETQRELVQRLYNMGETCREIAEKSGRAVYRVEALHRRALKRLRKELQPLVKELYGIGSRTPPTCAICASPNRPGIDAIIRNRDRKKSWRPVIKRLREDFGLRIRSPQRLIGHEKYH
jgi:hypothetical protein